MALNVEEIVNQLAGRSSETELFVLLLFAKRIREIGESGKPLTRKQKEEDLLEIKRVLDKHNILQKTDVKRLYEAVMNEAYQNSKVNFDYRSIMFLPFVKNKPLVERLTKFKEQVNTMEVFKTQAFMLRDPRNRKKLIPNPVAEAYNKVVNEAAEQVTKGIGDYQSAIRRTVKDLADNGMRTVWYEPESGRTYTQRVEAAVKRNILDNIRDINQETQDELGRQYGADGKEITVHEHSAPDHEPIQGHQFSNEEYEKLQNEQDFKDYKGIKFKAIKRRIGMWNCRHFTFSIILGLNKPNFTDKELEENIKRNHEGYTDPDGNHRTLYECSQEQRRLERLIRNNKMAQVVAKEAGDTELAREYQADINKYTDEYNEFSGNCGLPKHPENMRVSGYRKMKI